MPQTRRSLLMLPLALLGAPRAALAQQVAVQTGSCGGRVTVSAAGELKAPASTVWQVLTDYERLPDFIPYMQSSGVLQREGDRLLVQQRGRLDILFFHQTVQVELSVQESPERLIVVHAVGGDFRELEARYEVQQLPGGASHLAYFGTLVPAFAVPPLIGPFVLRTVMRRQFEALVAEIGRRG